MPIYLMFIEVLLSVQFCFALKTYLKGAPFYNASSSRRSPRSPFVDHQPARHPKSGGVSAQESDVIPAIRIYAASVLSGELPVSGEFLN
jgi:hypothetical protein